MWTICTDVKLPSVCFVLLLLVQQDFLAMYAGGPQGTWMARANEDPSMVMSCKPCVPAIFQFPLSEWQPAKPRTGKSIRFSFHFCTVVAIWHIYFILSSVASEPSSEQGRRKHTSN